MIPSEKYKYNLFKTTPMTEGKDYGWDMVDDILYLYSHVESDHKERERYQKNIYHIVTLVSFQGSPTHRNEYYVPAFRLHEFIEDFYTLGEEKEEIIHIEPVSEKEFKIAIITAQIAWGMEKKRRLE